MKTGDIVETAVWLTGTETPEMRRQYEAEVKNAIARAQSENGAILGPVVWTEKKPGEERVPTPPAHVNGPDVRLLVGEAKIVARAPVLSTTGSRFVADLDGADLAQLRAATRRAYANDFPGYPPLTDRQCDTLINDLGPEAALNTLRGARTLQ